VRKKHKIDHIPVSILQEGELRPIGLGWLNAVELTIRIEENDIVDRFESLTSIGQVEGIVVGFQYRTGEPKA
jgi:hypothetical protein